MSSSSFVTLPDGLTLPLTPLRLAWDLESRGLHLSHAGDILNVGPSDRLTETDRLLIRQWKSDLLAIVAFGADALGRPQ